MNLHQKLNQVQKIVKTVFKNANVSTGYSSKSYSAVSHDDVAALLHSPLCEAGIGIEVDMVSCEIEQIKSVKNNEEKTSYMAKVWMSVKFINSDDLNDSFTVKGFAYSFDASDKAVGKACSYAVKNIYLKNFNLESVDNEESRDYENSYQQQNSNSQPTQNKIDQFKESPATPAQLNALKKHYPQRDFTGLTKSAASKLFDEMNKDKK